MGANNPERSVKNPPAGRFFYGAEKGFEPEVVILNEMKNPEYNPR